MLVDRQGLISKLREVLTSFDKIVFALLFGSVAKDLSTPLSDIDIAIYSEKPVSYDELIELIFSISSKLKVPEDKVDIVILGDDTPYELRYKIFRDGILIFSRDENTFKRYRDKSISLYLDFKVFVDKLNLKKKYLEKLRRIAYG